jgi:hypothetical protein
LNCFATTKHIDIFLSEFANTLWAFATSGIRADAHVKLAKLMADGMDEGDGSFFGGYFKPQELANSGE